VVTGIEKVIPRLEDLAVLWPVLATSGTGQGITTYGTLIGGPRRAGETDGPEEFHVVLVDNGRSRCSPTPSNARCCTAFAAARA
jgi:L-lactate dehydrogenase complex protein LldF